MPNHKPHNSYKSINDAVYNLQHLLLDGRVKTLPHLHLAGHVISRSDFADVVTERAIAALCGYPLCRNPLPPEASRPRKGHYRISLQEHKVYDLRETKLYCSATCLIESKAFAAGLGEDRGVDSAKAERVLRVIEGGNEAEESGVEGLGFGKLRIEEKSESFSGEFAEFGASDAIEGYVPRRNRVAKKSERGSKGKDTKKEKTKKKPSGGGGGSQLILNDMDFMSTLLACDEYSVSKTPPSVAENCVDNELKSRFSEEGVMDVGELGMSRLKIEEEKSSEGGLRSSLKHSGAKRLSRSVTWADEKVASNGRSDLCEVKDMYGELSNPGAFESLLKSSSSSEAGSSFTWVDQTTVDSPKCENISKVSETHDVKELPEVAGSSLVQNSEWLESAEACALALSEAAAAVETGEADTSDAVLKAGIIILPRPDGEGEEQFIEDSEDEVDSVEDSLDEDGSTDDMDKLEPDQALSKWPKKPESSQYELFNPEDSWFDAPPDGFNISLSPFATMWNALFTWTTSSTLAYIYGKDDSSHEEFLNVNGRSYPPKIVLADGRSSEIKLTVGASLSRALPEIVAELGLAIPNLEKGMGFMLNTMSFIEALPAFRVKQWQVITLLFIEGLSVCRMPALTPRVTNRRVPLQRVLDGTHISVEEYEIMKDFLIPLGRAPQFSSQSGA